MIRHAGAPLRVALTSLGCKVNFAEMADLAGVLAAAGCDVVPESESADVRVLNSCTVTTQADATTRQRIARLRRSDPAAHLVLTGCSVDANPGAYTTVDSVVANRDKEAIASLILALSPTLGAPPRAAPALRSRAFIKVQDGCDHRCTYCIVWRARGQSRSVPVDEVASRVRAATRAGHSELVLCGVDLGSYGRDRGTDLAGLLGRLLERCGDAARIRLSSVNANDVTESLIALNAHPRLCAHWHMPLQSGSDRVLRAMHRGYRRAQYLRVARELRAADPATEITADIMVGFPGETEEDHQQTLALVDETGLLAAHVFRWSARPGTPAAALGARVDDATARRRSAEVRRAALRSGSRALERACGRVHEVAWEHVGHAESHGLTAGYHEVVVAAGAGLRASALSSVRAVAVEGRRLRATLLRS